MGLRWLVGFVAVTMMVALAVPAAESGDAAVPRATVQASCVIDPFLDLTMPDLDVLRAFGWHDGVLRVGPDHVYVPVMVGGGEDRKVRVIGHDGTVIGDIAFWVYRIDAIGNLWGYNTGNGQSELRSPTGQVIKALDGDVRSPGFEIGQYLWFPALGSLSELSVFALDGTLIASIPEQTDATSYYFKREVDATKPPILSWVGGDVFLITGNGDSVWVDRYAPDGQHIGAVEKPQDRQAGYLDAVVATGGDQGWLLEAVVPDEGDVEYYLHRVDGNALVTSSLLSGAPNLRGESAFGGLPSAIGPLAAAGGSAFWLTEGVGPEGGAARIDSSGALLAVPSIEQSLDIYAVGDSVHVTAGENGNTVYAFGSAGQLLGSTSGIGGGTDSVFASDTDAVYDGLGLHEGGFFYSYSIISRTGHLLGSLDFEPWNHSTEDRWSDIFAVLNTPTLSSDGGRVRLYDLSTCTPDGIFIDDEGSVFENDIEWLAEQEITQGCNPPANDRFCPNAFVTRDQMAAFLVRALNLTDDGGGDLFEDDDNTIFESAIDKLATAGITRGCNPSEGNTEFCPHDYVTRGQMAAFLVRALGYTDDGGGDLFDDDDGNIFESAIDKLATAGVTRGCNPGEGNTKFCPHDYVTRGQMAAFLHRALG